VSAKTKTTGHTAKHTSSAKHTATSKHNPAKTKTAATKKATGAKVTTKAKTATHAKAVGFAAGDLLPVCAFEALAASLRLAGAVVAEDDLMELWWLAGAREVTIAESLGAAARFGLAGVRPSFREADWPGRTHLENSGVLLGVDVPGPHAVLATPHGWWSWGELHAPWPARVFEAWAVSWS
jgi:hypothetical protein